MWEFLGVVFGAFVSIVASVGTVVWVEFLRRPRLYLERAQPTGADYSPDFPATHVRSLRVRLQNRRLPSWADRWMVRDAALQCRARITFHFLEDENAQFDRTMAGRWTNTPEPAPLFINNPRDGGDFAIIPQLVEAVTVYPGENELLDIAVRLNDEADCYGWDNEFLFDGLAQSELAIRHRPASGEGRNFVVRPKVHQLVSPRKCRWSWGFSLGALFAKNGPLNPFPAVVT